MSKTHKIRNFETNPNTTNKRQNTKKNSSTTKKTNPKKATTVFCIHVYYAYQQSIKTKH